MYYSDEIIEEVKNANDIVDVISGYVQLTKKGASWFGLCPFHSEKTPSFSVSRSKQIYYCFGCHSGGNVISFVMQYENYTFDEALRFLADRAGIRLPEVSLSTSERKDKDLKTRLMEIHRIAANHYYHELVDPRSPAGLDYFHKRKLSDDTIRHFGLGYTGIGSSKLYKLLKEKGYDDYTIKESGLVTIEEKGTHDKFWNRVMFPLMDINNRVIGFGGRVLGDGLPKYMNSPETKIFEKNRFLFGLNYARKTRRDYFFLCEGNMDVIAMHQAGYTNAVASLGTSLTANQPSLIKRYVNKVILTYDSDDAGIAAAMRAIPMLNDAGISVKILDLAPCKDPDEFLTKMGAEEMDRRIADAENSFVWSIGILRKKYDMQDPQQKTEFEHKAAEQLCSFSEPLERDNYTRAVCTKYMIPYEELKSLVNSTGNKGYGINAANKSIERPRLRRADDGIMKTQSFLISSICADKSLVSQVKELICADDFDGDLYKEIAGEIFSGTSASELMDRYAGDRDMLDRAAQILNYSEEENSSELKAAVAAAILRIKQNSLDRDAKNAADIAALQNVIKEQAAWKSRKIVLR